MGDIHFILRHSLTGAVFLLFFIAGCWSVQPEATIAFLSARNLGDLSDFLTFVISSAMIGITIQGAHILLVPSFQDAARQIVARQVRPMFEKENLGSTEQSLIAKADADAFFVWLYHRLAPNDLIEWARRRRSYYYLGVNWTIACAAGWIAGALWPWGSHLSHGTQLAIALVASLIWCICALVLARSMRKDADDMEFLWSAARVRPELRKELTDLLSPQDETKLGGSLDVRLRKPAPEPEAQPVRP